LSTQAILDTLTAHKRDRQADLFDLFSDPKRSVVDQVLRAYEHRDKWVNRMVLGDSLVAMTSLLQYEGMGGQVQMIYIDPPYGVKFGSNFQPFVRKRDVKDGDDADLTREPEMVQAYRDTWELGLHSYLTYLRDRLLVARDLLTPSGSVFVQISDENLHHVRELMDEVFGSENLVAVITFAKTSGQRSNLLAQTADFILWYSRTIDGVKYRAPFTPKLPDGVEAEPYNWIDLPDGTRRRMSAAERADPDALPSGARRFQPTTLTSQNPGSRYSVSIGGAEYVAGGSQWWKTDQARMSKLIERDRVVPVGRTLRYVRYIDDFAAMPLSASWTDTGVAGFAADKLYVVQTSTKVIQRCILMTTDPGDLVLDPTCGSGTTAYVAEQWGRRWITIDTSRVPLALARQRLLTATYPWYRLKDDIRGPASGFDYQRKQNRKGEEVGGLVPHITLKSIANDEPPQMEVLVDRPEEDKSITRVAGPFVVEATIPTPVDWEGDGDEDSSPAAAEAHGSFVDRMLEVLRRSPSLQLGGNTTLELEQVRAPAKSLVLNAEALVKGTKEVVAFVFGPEHGAVAEPLVHQALKEANIKSYSRLFVLGFAIDPYARKLVDEAHAMGLPAATYVQATPDVVMGALLKTTRASQIFSVCGLPDVDVKKAKVAKGEPERWQVVLNGLDTFDPVTMQAKPAKGADVPAWLLDQDYNGRVFRVHQAFFPRGAWDAMRKALKGDFEDSVFEHLASDTSAPFELGEHRKVAVKVIDDRGNELMVVRDVP
jgi:adenine-specific DNA-methyltransferase